MKSDRRLSSIPRPQESGKQDAAGPLPEAEKPSRKQTLIESVGREKLDSRDIKAVARAALEYLSGRVRAETLLFGSWEYGRLVVQAAAGPRKRRFTGSKHDITGCPGSIYEGSQSEISLGNLGVEAPLQDSLTAKLIELGACSAVYAAVGEIGLLVAADQRLEAFSSADIAEVAGVGYQLGYIIENIIDLDTQDESLNHLERLVDSVNHASKRDGARQAIAPLLELAVELSGADRGSFLAHDEESGTLRFLSGAGLGGSVPAIEIPLGEGIAGWVGRHRKPVKVTDLDSGEALGNGLGSSGVATALSLPVTIGDELVGVVNLGSATANYEFSAEALVPTLGLLAQVSLTMSMREQKTQWRSMYVDTVRVLAQMIESRNEFNRGHSARVAGLATILAERMKLQKVQVEMIELAGHLHDIGVAAIDENLLAKDRMLSSSERLVVRNHPRLGADAIGDIHQIRTVLPIVLNHHQHFDGTGGVEGLSGPQIPIGARIMAVAEAYAGMTAERPHRKAKSSKEALNELRSGAGSQFDPEVVEAICRLEAYELEVKP